jgi:biopolymer transport protein ExbB
MRSVTQARRPCPVMRRWSLFALLLMTLSVSIDTASAQSPTEAAPRNPAEITPQASPPVAASEIPQRSLSQAQPPAIPTPTPGTRGKTLPQDLSPWGMFMAADVVVKAVMIGLAFASLVTWTVWLAKAIELGHARRRLRRGIAHILAAHDLNDAVSAFDGADDTSAVLVREAADEVRVSVRVLDHTDGRGVSERVTSRLSRVEADAGRRMMMGTGILATIGATAPFVGLFGTVWGIMNSFIGISQAQTTNLAVVAPGIAEALLATALGLVAAIPAVIIYNVFARSIANYRRLLADASAGIERLVSRELDFRHVPSRAAALSRAAE